MAILQLIPDFGVNWTNKAVPTIPAWYSGQWNDFVAGISDKSKWWYDGTTDIFYHFEGMNSYVQVGQDIQDYASARFHSLHVEISNEVQQPDNHVTAHIKATAGFFGARNTSHAQAGFTAKSVLYLGTTPIWAHDGNSIDQYEAVPSPNVLDIDVDVAPQQELSTALLRLVIQYPNGEASTLNLNVGGNLFNPLPNTYVPMAIRKSGAYKALNDHAGTIKARKSGSWADKSKENNATSLQADSGHSRIRLSKVWKQLPAMHD